MEEDNACAHDPEALADKQRDKRHINHGGYTDKNVVDFCKDAVRLAHIAPNTPQRHANKALTYGDERSKLNGRLGGIPDLAPVVAAKVICTKPELLIGSLKA